MHDLTARTQQLVFDLQKLIASSLFEQYYIYNPLDYAWNAHIQLITRYGSGNKRICFLGMNPGPYGMLQTSVPFGVVSIVKNWMGIYAPINTPPHMHPKRPITGFHTTRNEVSGMRLWTMIQNSYHTAADFFAEHYILNYCPLAFFNAQGQNITPAQLRVALRRPLERICDAALYDIIRILQFTHVVCLGRYAYDSAVRVSIPTVTYHQLQHPSPANPHANKNWKIYAEQSLQKWHVWPHISHNTTDFLK